MSKFICGFVVLVLSCLFAALPARAATLDDLKKLEIICLVPSYLPDGMKLKSVEITSDDAGDEFPDRKAPLPLYGIEYAKSDKETSFSIESAREGIGDRNIMEEEDTEESEIQTPLGTMYLIWRPKGKTGRKAELMTNWLSDANMNAENAKNGENSHPILGRFHGFTGTGMSVAEFTKILQSLRPIRVEEKPEAKVDAKAAPSPAPAASPTVSPADSGRKE